MKLILTCGARPEQYDLVDDNGDQIGHFRLRHGTFRAEDALGQTVYLVHELASDGLFDSDERTQHMTAGLDAMLRANDQYEPGLTEQLLRDAAPEDAIDAWMGEDLPVD